MTRIQITLIDQHNRMYDLSPQPSTSLEDVIGNMKDTLKAIRNDVNHKTLKDLNRAGMCEAAFYSAGRGGAGQR